jgi:IS30 family transposase
VLGWLGWAVESGWCRQYLPKGVDLHIHTAADLAVIEHKLNTRPRKILGWKTPSEVFNMAP